MRPGDRLADNLTSQRLRGRYKWANAFLPEVGVLVDVGSSTSPLHPVLHTKAKTVIAVDVDRPALERLTQCGLGILPVEGSASALPIRSGIADAVLLLDVLEHVDDEAGTISEVHRVLRHEGWLVLSVPHDGIFAFLDPQNLRARMDGTLSPATFHRHYTMGQLNALFDSRFRLVKKHYGGLVFYPLMFAADNFVRKHLSRDWGRVFKAVSDLENDISFGRLSYNLILLAQKR